MTSLTFILTFGAEAGAQKGVFDVAVTLKVSLASKGGYVEGSTQEPSRAIFFLDDSNDPGLAEVQLLRFKGEFRGQRVWEVKIIKVIKSSFASAKVGQKRVVVETLLTDIR